MTSFDRARAATVDVWKHLRAEFQQIADHPEADVDQATTALETVMACNDVIKTVEALDPGWRNGFELRHFLNQASVGFATAHFQLATLNSLIKFRNHGKDHS